MTKTATCQKKEIKHEGMKVHIEFPESAANDSGITKEVKNILANALCEHMKKIS